MITDSEKQRILGEIDMQLTRSIAKHGNWDNLTFEQMTSVIFNEYA